MIELQHIKAETCETCGASVQLMERKNRHCNGHWNEYVQYACGHRVHFSPNHMRTVVERRCPNTAEEQARRANNRGYLDRMVAMAVDDDSAEPALRDAVLSSLRGLYYSYTES